MVKKCKVKIYKRKPRGRGWVATDPVRNLKQGKAFVCGGYAGADAVLVRTGKKGDVFPFTVYTKERR